jgi:hypothetical protein
MITMTRIGRFLSLRAAHFSLQGGAFFLVASVSERATHERGADRPPGTISSPRALLSRPVAGEPAAVAPLPSGIPTARAGEGFSIAAL